jgi:adenylate kinase family enzyme
MKVFVIGAAGSGKTTFAQRLAEAAGMEMTNLDGLFWINDGKSYGVQRPEKERDALFEEVLSRPGWIMEGAYIDWTDRAAREADIVVFMDVGKWRLRRRIFRRFLRRKAGIDTENKKESLRSLIDILAWNRTQIVKIRAFVAELESERKVLRMSGVSWK